MAKYKAVLLAEARDALREIALIYKAKVGPQAAKRITNRILAAVSKLEEFPFMGVLPPLERVVNAGYRMLITDDYLIFYTVSGTSIYVTLIIHESTDYIKRLRLHD